MDDFQDDDDEDDTEGETFASVCGISFEKLKSKMTSVIENGKVNVTFLQLLMSFVIIYGMIHFYGIHRL